MADLAGKVIADKWKVLEPLGEGGVGSVWRGEHVSMGRPVAIKVLHALFAAQPEFRKRFEREARAASKLNHPACVSVLDFGDFEGQLYLVMEFAAGRLLADRLDDGPIDAVESVQIARGIAAALRHAHSLDIVHRDLKPGNVILLDSAATGVPCKLLDFGLAKSVHGGEQLTVAGTVFGTPGYLSPEQGQGAPADARSDLYALGIVMWEMLAGDKPFSGPDPIEVLRAHINTPAPPVREFAPRTSVQLERVIARLLDKDPGQRYQNADELMAALAKLPEVTGVAPTEAVRLPGAVRLPQADRRSIQEPLPEPERRTAKEPAAQKAQAAQSPRAAQKPPAAQSPRAAHKPAAAQSPRAAEKRSPTLEPSADLEPLTVPETPAVRVRAWQVALGSVVAIALFGGAAFYWRTARPAPPLPRQPSRMVLPPDPVSLPNRIEPAAARHAALGRQYIAKLWCPDGIGEYKRAIEIDPMVRTDPRTVDDGLRCLVESNHGRPAAMRFLAETVGPPAEKRLRILLSQTRSPDVRRAVEDTLARIR